MYESEVNRKVENSAQVPDEVLNDFRAFRKIITRKSLLPWTEHCVECVWPTCYQTCTLYSPREDGKCQRFENGIVKIPIGDSSDQYLMKVTFKKWGKLLSQGTTRLHDSDEVIAREQNDQRVAGGIKALPLPKPVRKRIVQKRYGIKNRRASSESTHTLVDGSMLAVECYNPGDKDVDCTLLIRPEGKGAHMPFQKLLRIGPGYNRVLIPSEEVTTDLSGKFKIELTPNGEELATLIFGVVDFVLLETASKPKIKCIVWDLDNTLWKGVLVEDGAEKLKLRDGIVETIKTLDRSGILQSIASKNDFETAMAVLKSLDLEEYFLYPQIHWGPKSQSIDQIVTNLNIGMNTILFVDDQIFEREEAQGAHPELRVLDPETLSSIQDILKLVEKKDTPESRRRRKLYQDEMVRNSEKTSFDGKYFDFLHSCNIVLDITGVNDENIERVHELVQRTNQMNFSGHRYTKDDLLEMVESGKYAFHVLKVNDKFGDYGIVGLGIFELQTNTLIDLTFSCRIQSKRIEHAYLQWLLAKHLDDYPKVVYNKTRKNEPSGRVFDDLGFVAASGNGADQLLIYPQDAAPQNEQIITVHS